MSEFEDILGIVPIFGRSALDASALLLSDDSEYTVTRYEKRLKPLLIGLVDTLRQSAILTDDTEIIEYQYMIEKFQTDLVKEYAMTLEDIREGNRLAMMDIAGQILGGDEGSSVTVSIDENGDIVISDGGGSGLPSTPDGLRARMGAMEYIEIRLEEYIEDYADFWSTTVADADLMTLYLTSKYSMNANVSDAVADYIAYRGVPNNAPDNSFDGLDRDMQCKGYTKQVVSAWYIDNGASDIELILSLIGSLTDDQFDTWYNESGDAISNDYQNTACYRNPDVSLEFDGSGWIKLNSPTRSVLTSFSDQLLTNRKYLVFFSGQISNANGDTYDGMYRVLSGGGSTYLPIKDNSNAAEPDSQPQQSNDGYEVIYNNADFDALQTLWDLPAGNYDTGTINMTVKDFGAI